MSTPASIPASIMLKNIQQHHNKENNKKKTGALQMTSSPFSVALHQNKEQESSKPQPHQHQQNIDETTIYDFIIIGGGASGYSAAIYAARYGMKTLVITKERGGLITTTHLVENWPGFAKISGQELMDKIEAHVKEYPVTIVDDYVTTAEKKGLVFLLTTESGKQYQGYALLLATGTKRRILNVPGEKEYYGKGVSYCATCDGPLFRNKRVGVVGGSDSAAKEALFLSEHAKEVYIIYRRQEIRAEPINKERVYSNPKITIIPNTNVVEICGD
ncbi:MAG: FAD-dependent oxidoreductase, partial [Candidatus Woesearchaeota archaeon]